ncbi:protein LTO1 homolog [Sitodiplosis mosellana]|uniref:protein LTO1 homolog n=1 Tax=Sitodiplosis mosellana TaxID=263140 RepID=UPI002445175A|nr:protein LTO1 homolog [Sitodiplosis mosellana]
MSTIETRSESEKTASNRDINDIFDDIALSEERINEESYQKGLTDGQSIGNTDGYHLGYHRGAELGAELGYYYGVLQSYANREQNTERQQKSIDLVLNLIGEFPRTNDEEADILRLADTIRAQYRKTCAILKINGKYPESDQLSF